MRKISVFISLLFFIAPNVFAGNLPAGTALSNEVASVMQTKAVQRGFAANDPRYVAGLSAVSTVAVEIGVGIVAVGTAPAWGTLLATAAVAGVVGYGAQSLTNWVFNSDGTVTIPAGTSLPYGAGKTLTAGQPYFKCGPDPYYIGASPEDACLGRLAYYNSGAAGNYGQGTLTTCKTNGWCYQVVSVNGTTYPEQQLGSWVNLGNYTGSTCTGSMPLNGSTCTASQGSFQPATKKPVADSLAGLTPAQKAVTLSPQDVAAIVDSLWKAAASKPGYSGLPYVSSDPVTSADVVATRAANPNLAVSTVGDLAATIPTVGAVTPAVGSTADAAVNSNVNPSTQPQINLGSDPAIGAPSLESTPTAQMILQPVLNLLPSFKNFVVPAHTATCPKPSITIYSSTFSLESHCQLAESIRPTIYAVMAVVWLVLAFIIVLGA